MNELTDSWGNRLLQNDFMDNFCFPMNTCAPLELRSTFQFMTTFQFMSTFVFLVIVFRAQGYSSSGGLAMPGGSRSRNHAQGHKREFQTQRSALKVLGGTLLKRVTRKRVLFLTTVVKCCNSFDFWRDLPESSVVVSLDHEPTAGRPSLSLSLSLSLARSLALSLSLSPSLPLALTMGKIMGLCSYPKGTDFLQLGFCFRANLEQIRQ